MRQRKTQRPATRIADLARYMSGLHADQQRLTEIQGAYDNLALLGQLLCAGTDITGPYCNFAATGRTQGTALYHSLWRYRLQL